MKTQDQPGYPLTRKCRAHFPKTIFEAPHQWPPNWPAELHSHEVEPDSVPVGLVEATQPIEHRGPAGFRAVNRTGTSGFSVIYPHLNIMYHKWYSVQPFVLSRRESRANALAAFEHHLRQHAQVVHDEIGRRRSEGLGLKSP